MTAVDGGIQPEYFRTDVAGFTVGVLFKLVSSGEVDALQRHPRRPTRCELQSTAVTVTNGPREREVAAFCPRKAG
jgi:hypothetical protein